MSAVEQLTHLLVDLFTPDQLKQFLHFGPDGDELVRSFPSTTVPFDGAYQAVDLLRRHGLVDADFFGRLRQVRPRRAADIDAVERAWPTRRAEVIAETHVVLLVAAIAGQVSAIDDGQVRAALGATREIGRLRLDLHDLEPLIGDPSIWLAGQARIQTAVQEYLRTTVLASPAHHVSVFGQAPIPWLMTLGYALSETVEARVHQRLREPSTWCWQNHEPALDTWQTRVVADAPFAREVAVLVSASAPVRPERVQAALSTVTYAAYEITLAEPRYDAVRSPEQLEEFGRHYRRLFARIEAAHPEVERVHVFAAAPVAVAVDCGRKLLHSADPVVVTYQLHERRYVRALELRP